jgi:hypothetical protein
MTCQELHCYLENPLRIDVYMYRETLPAPVSEHLEKCRDCARRFEEQKTLGISLNLVRDAAPQVSPAVDATVLASYRRHLAEPQIFSTAKRAAWGFSNTWLRWGVATTALAGIALVLFLVSRNPAPTTAEKVVSPQTHAPAIAGREPDAAAKEAGAVETVRTETHVARASTASKVASRSLLPPGFSSLMYCDEMSCSGAMEVIRVELPAPQGAMPNSADSGAPTMAEVLVGADGIARGIRIVQ